MMPLFHRHRWTDWAITDRGEVNWRGAKVGWYIVQERYCHSCGKTKIAERVSYGEAPRHFCNRQSTMLKSPRKDGVAA